jgi:hypothetical protein
MPVTFTGLAAAIFLLGYALRHGVRRSLIHPFPWICFAYLRYFGLPAQDPEMAPSVDLANLLAFFLFTGSFLLAEHLLAPAYVGRLLTLVWQSDQPPGSRPRPLPAAVVLVLGGLSFAWAIYGLALASIEYGGLEHALVRFYAGAPVDVAPPWLKRLAGPLLGLAFAGLLAIRIDWGVHRRLLSRAVFYVASAAILLAQFTSGTVGNLLLPLFALLLGDALAALHNRAPFRIGPGTVVLSAVVLLGAMTLLALRGTRFDSPQELADHLQGNLERTLTEGETSLLSSHMIVADDIGFCLRTYGVRRDFLGPHTVYSIAVNPMPRELWPGKPDGFGKLLAEEEGFSDDSGVSLAAGLAGEGWANAGVLGIAGLAVLFGAVCGLAARAAVSALLSGSFAHEVLGIQLWFLATLFVRGDMLSAWTTTLYPLLVSSALLMILGRLRPLLRGD